MIRFLADENISPLTVKYIKEQGYDIVTVTNISLKSKPDEEIVHWAAKNNHIILTFDLDFGTIYYFSSKKTTGIIVLRLKPQTIENANEAIKKLLSSNILDKVENRKALLIVDKIKVRIKR